MFFLSLFLPQHTVSLRTLLSKAVHDCCNRCVAHPSLTNVGIDVVVRLTVAAPVDFEFAALVLLLWAPAVGHEQSLVILMIFSANGKCRDISRRVPQLPLPPSTELVGRWFVY